MIEELNKKFDDKNEEKKVKCKTQNTKNNKDLRLVFLQREF